MSSRKTRVSSAARDKIVELGTAGYSAHAVARYLNEHGYRPPKARAWFRATVRYVMQQEGVYSPGLAHETPLEAVDLIVSLGRRGKSSTQTLQALEASGLRPAHGGAWRDSTVRRIRERHGIGSRKQSPNERFTKSYAVDPQSGCHAWTSRTLDGYGLFEVDGHNVHAHRWAWEREHGPLPADLHLHHVCRNTACVRPGHLLPVHPAEHRAIEREEDALISAIQSGALENLRELGPGPDANPVAFRLGALRPTEVAQ